MQILNILPPTDKNIKQIANRLRLGAIAAIPTETVYGLAGVVYNEDALAKIFAAKERPTFDPLIVHIAVKPNDPWGSLLNTNLILEKCLSQQAIATTKILAQNFWPGPFTMVLPKNPKVPDLATAGLSTVAVRMPNHPIMQTVLQETGVPLAAPSANRFGRISPTCAEHVKDELGNYIECILDGGPCAIGVESTIVWIEPETAEVSVLRPGGIAKEEIEKVLGRPVLGPQEIQHSPRVTSPGLLKSHYAPSTPLYTLQKSFSETSKEELQNLNLPKEIALLCLQTDPSKARETFKKFGHHIKAAEFLGSSEAIAAQNLFRTLRELDHAEVSAILAEPCPNQLGLWLAIEDRIKRASTRTEH